MTKIFIEDMHSKEQITISDKAIWFHKPITVVTAHIHQNAVTLIVNKTPKVIKTDNEYYHIGEHNPCFASEKQRKLWYASKGFTEPTKKHPEIG